MVGLLGWTLQAAYQVVLTQQSETEKLRVLLTAAVIHQAWVDE